MVKRRSKSTAKTSAGQYVLKIEMENRMNELRDLIKGEMEAKDKALLNAENYLNERCKVLDSLKTQNDELMEKVKEMLRISAFEMAEMDNALQKANDRVDVLKKRNEEVEKMNEVWISVAIYSQHDCDCNQEKEGSNYSERADSVPRVGEFEQKAAWFLRPLIAIWRFFKRWWF